jgi:TolB-like protein
VEPTPEEVRAQLERLLASETLATAARLRRFLRFIVERTLDGEGQQLKEYAVGIEVFERDERYDPRIDSIVRVEAGRLRARLHEYYSQAGIDDAVIVRIPRGGYVPVFERRPLPPSSSPASNGSGAQPSVSSSRAQWQWTAVAALATSTMLLIVMTWWPRTESAAASRVPRMRVAVLPFAHYSTDPADALLAARITDGVTSELVRSASLDVVSRTSTLQFANVRRPLKEVAQSLNANIVVEGSVLTEGGRVRVQARVVDPDVDRKVSLHEFEGGRNDLDELQRKIAKLIDASARPAITR